MRSSTGDLPGCLPTLGSQLISSLPRSVTQTGATVLARLRAQHYDWRRECRASTDARHSWRTRPLPVEISGQLVSLLSFARQVVIPDAGHMPFWEAPDVFFPLVG